MAGRRPLPTATKHRRGNPGKRQASAKEPKPRPGIPDQPRHLRKAARDAWDRLATLLHNDMHVLTTADGIALELLTEAYADFLAARAIVLKRGRTYETVGPSGLMIRTHPAVGQMADAWRRVRLALGEFGLTPSSRSKVHGETGDDDPLGEFLSGK